MSGVVKIMVGGQQVGSLVHRGDGLFEASVCRFSPHMKREVVSSATKANAVEAAKAAIHRFNINADPWRVDEIKGDVKLEV